LIEESDRRSRTEVVEPPATLLAALGHIGPGLILAGAIVGTGELIATTNAGARTGFALLWLVLVSCFIKVFVQVELGRYAIASGQPTFTAFRSLPGMGPVVVAWCALMIVTTMTQVGAMAGGVGQALHILAPGATAALAQGLSAVWPAAGETVRTMPELPWAVLTTLVTIGLLSTGSYALVEKGTTALVVTFTFVTIAIVVFLPPGASIRPIDVMQGLTFHIPAGAAVAAFTMFGITGVGATELLAYPYWCVEKGYARAVGPRSDDPAWATRALGWIRVLRLDAWASMVLYTVSTLAFYLLGAAILHGRTDGKGLPDDIDGVIRTLATMYEPVLGPRRALGFLVLGAFAVLYSTFYAATAANARMLTDFLRVNRLIDPDSESARRLWIRRLGALLPALAFGIYLVVRNPVLLVTIGGMMQAVTLPVIALAAVFLRYRRLDRRLQPGRAWDIMLWLSLLGLSLAATYSIWKVVWGRA
jgi:Mn2+/Fe2+ NRAMP family transporter